MMKRNTEGGGGWGNSGIVSYANQTLRPNIIDDLVITSTIEQVS